MTKKDYILIANGMTNAIREIKARKLDTHEMASGFEIIMQSLCKELLKDNKSFDESKFFKYFQDRA